MIWDRTIPRCLVPLLFSSMTLLAQSTPDSVTLSGSPQIGDTRNILLERLQYREGNLRRNDFVRDYSPFDTWSLSTNQPSSLGDELQYRASTDRHTIGLSTTENAVSLSLIPLLGGTYFASRNGTPYWKRSSGLAVSGSIGDNVVFYAKAVDNVVRGASPDMQNSLSAQPAYVTSIKVGSDGYDYDDSEMQLGFRLGMVDLYVEKIRNMWGYGRGGQEVLSGKAPSYPQLRASIQLLHNLKFTVFGAVLNSGLIDSIQTYTDYSADGTFQMQRSVYRSKFLFAHVLEYSPVNELNLAVGEEVVVSDRFMPQFFLLPIAFYHNLYIETGGVDNLNIWGGARYTQPGLGSAYTTIYVDDFNFSQGFYIVAGTLGGTLVDIGHRDIDLTAEYTALRPFVYANDISSLWRTSNGYPLGDWLGQNGQRIQAWLDYRPLPEIWLTASYTALWKGLPGTVAQEYKTGQIASIEFLGGPLFKRHELDLQGRWEIYSGLFADLSYRLISQTDQVVDRYPTFSGRSFLAFSVKLNIFDRNDDW